MGYKFEINDEKYGKIACWKYNYGESYFYHITIPKFEGKHESVFNYGKEFKIIRGNSSWCLRIGDTINGEQFFICMNRFENENSNISTQPARWGSIDKNFSETYFPIDSIDFTKKCLEVFKRIISFRDEKNQAPKLDVFKEIMMDVF